MWLSEMVVDMDGPHFFEFHENLSKTSLIVLLREAKLLHDSEPDLTGFPARFTKLARLVDAGSTDISFFHNARYVNDLSDTKAGLILVPEGLSQRLIAGKPCLIVRDVHRAMALIGSAFVVAATPTRTKDPTAIVAETAKIGKNVTLGPYVVVESHVQIGDNTVIGPHCHIGEKVVLGQGCRIDSGVTLSHAIIGEYVHIKPGARIGQRGFGWALSPEGHVAKPQVGRVIIGAHVEIGANTAVDRGSLEDTMIGAGTVIDNLCHIAHNCQIGSYCALAANTAFAGTTILGDFVRIGGAVASKGHVNVGTGALVRIDSFIGTHISDGADVAGRPARAITAYQRLLRHWSRASRGAKST